VLNYSGDKVISLDYGYDPQMLRYVARDKRIGPYTRLLVENVRERVAPSRHHRHLGRKEVVVARGDLDRLARSVVRLAQRSMVLSLVEGEAPPNARCHGLDGAAVRAAVA